MEKYADKKSDKMALGPRNIRLMIAGLVVLAAGFLLLSGGGTTDPQVFNYDMFDVRRLVAAPVVMVAALVVETVAIMARFREE